MAEGLDWKRRLVRAAKRWTPGWAKTSAKWFFHTVRFWVDYGRFRGRARRASGRFTLRTKDLYPCLHDRTATTSFDAHYVFHTSWAARVLERTRPSLHLDFSSSLFFVGIASSFVPIRFYDYRPARLGLKGLECLQGDLLKLPLADGSAESVSCMHVVEHVGLGRYGDPLDYDGDLKALAELKRIVKPGGNLLFVVPVGVPRIQFNAHRIYGLRQVLGLFEGFELKERALVTDQGEFVPEAGEELSDAQGYGCACFWFSKKGTGSGAAS